MSCNVKSKIDTSSLYRNGVLINSSDVSFDVLTCNNVNINIIRNVICCGKMKINRITFIVENTEDSDISNGKLNVFVTSINCNLTRTFEIVKIKSKCKDSVYIDVPFNCCFNYSISAQVVIEEKVIKEKCISI